MPIWLEITLFTLYVFLGPLTWGFMILAMFEGRRRMSVLLKKTAPLPNPAPRVTVMIPARNEEANIEKCVSSVLAQDYPNLDIIVTNDRSTDATGQILDRLAATHPTLRVVHCTQADILPGWAGKSNALHNAYEKGVRGESENGGIGETENRRIGKSATFNSPALPLSDSPLHFLLGLDSDVRLTSPSAISRCVRAAIKHNAGIFTLLPALESHTFFEGLVIPLTGMISSSINAVALTNVDSFRGVAYANGQYLLIRRDVYDSIGGHTQVGPFVCEDVALARLVKGSGGRVRVAWGADLCAVRMYDSLGALYGGLARIIAAAGELTIWPILAGIAFLLLCGLSLYAAAIYGCYRLRHPLTNLGAAGWLMACTFHWLTMTVQLGLTYAWSKNRWWYALLFPIAGPISLAIYCRALKQRLTGRVEWRGVSYTLGSTNAIPPAT
jgi:cellulose synthase/poly-beta-1,6-N-acetylglucosamine synthase-like glycosyltransferase